jgi:hypothetical protein
MKKAKESRLAKIPAWALLLVIFIVSIISASVFEYVTIPGNSTLGIIGSIFYVVLIPVACFIICMTHPKTIWYTPFICNPVALLGTIFHPLAWTTLSEYLIWVISIVLSILGAIIGAKIGQRKNNQVE